MTIESERISAFIEGKIRRAGVLLEIDASYEIDKPFDDNRQVELILKYNTDFGQAVGRHRIIRDGHVLKTGFSNTPSGKHFVMYWSKVD